MKSKPSIQYVELETHGNTGNEAEGVHRERSDMNDRIDAMSPCYAPSKVCRKSELTMKSATIVSARELPVWFSLALATATGCLWFL
jgi:hypothetical protein